MLGYRDKIDMPDTLTLREAEEIEEMMRGYGGAERDGNAIRFSFVSDGDRWDICEVAYAIAGELQSRGVPYIPDKEYVFDTLDPD